MSIWSILSAAILLAICFACFIPIPPASPSEFAQWGVTYQRIAGKPADSKDRAVEMRIQTNDDADLGNKIVFSVFHADPAAPGVFAILDGVTKPVCSVVEQGKPSGVDVPIKLSENKRGFILDFFGSLFLRNTLYQVKNCQVYISPHSDDQFNKQLVWTAKSIDVPALVPFDALTPQSPYHLSTIKVAPLNEKNVLHSFDAAYTPYSTPFSSQLVLQFSNVLEIAKKCPNTLYTAEIAVNCDISHNTSPPYLQTTVVIDSTPTDAQISLAIEKVGDTTIIKPVAIQIDELSVAENVILEFHFPGATNLPNSLTFPFALSCVETSTLYYPDVDPIFQASQPKTDDFSVTYVGQESPQEKNDRDIEIQFTTLTTIDERVKITAREGLAKNLFQFAAAPSHHCTVSTSDDPDTPELVIPISSTESGDGFVLDFTQLHLAENTKYKINQCDVFISPTSVESAEPFVWSVKSNSIPSLVPIAWDTQPISTIQVAAISHEKIHPFTIQYSPFSATFSPTLTLSFGNIAPLAQECTTFGPTSVLVVDFDIILDNSIADLNVLKISTVSQHGQSQTRYEPLSVQKQASGGFLVNFVLAAAEIATARVVTVDFVFHVSKISPAVAFPFSLNCASPSVLWVPDVAPVFTAAQPQFQAESWGVIYATPAYVDPSSRERAFSLSFTTIDSIQAPLVFTFDEIDPVVPGPFVPSGPHSRCSVARVGQADAPVFVPATLTQDARSMILDFTDPSLNLASNSNYRVFQCTITLSPQNDRQFNKPARWTARLFSVPELTPNKPNTLLLSAKQVPAMNSDAPGPGPIDFNFNPAVDSILSQYVDHLHLSITSIPSITPSQETFDLVLDFLDTTRIRPSVGKMTARSTCFDSHTRTETGSVVLESQFTAVSGSKIVIKSATFPKCPELDKHPDQFKESSLGVWVDLLELSTSPFKADLIATCLNSKQEYRSHSIFSSTWAPSLGNGVRMENKPADNNTPVPKQLHPYTASFTPITVNLLSSDLSGQSLTLASNATSHISDQRVELFQYFKQGGEPLCDLGKFGKLTPYINGDATEMTIPLQTLEHALKAGDSFTLNCPNWYIHLTDITRASPLSYTLSTPHQRREFDFSSINDSNPMVSSWVQPAIFSGPPTPDDDDDDDDDGDNNDKPRKSYKLLLALVITISTAIIAAVLYFLYKRGTFGRFVFSKKSSGDSHRLIDENQGYSTIQ